MIRRGDGFEFSAGSIASHVSKAVSQQADKAHQGQVPAIRHLSLTADGNRLDKGSKNLL